MKLVDALHPPSPANGSLANNGATRRPKLLFLAHRFPPAGTIASVRGWNIAKSLARLGWEVTVVTPDPSVFRHVDNQEQIDAAIAREGIRRIFTGHDRRYLLPYLLRWPDRGIGRLAGGVGRIAARWLDVERGSGWIEPAQRACAHLTPNDVDLILASGPPFSGFTLAKRLSDRLRRPYVLDYRDPWTDSELRTHTLKVHKYEAKLIAGSAAVITVSDSKATVLDRDFRVGARLCVLTNGYDDEPLSHIEPFDFGHFAIVYAGTFYPPMRVISPILAALKKLESRTQAGKVYFHYYGDHEDHVREEAERFGVKNRVLVHGRVPRAEALSASRGAGVAVVISSVFDTASINDKGIVPGKIFELIGLNVPILLVAPPGSDIEAILRSTGSGKAFTGSDDTAIAEYILDLMTMTKGDFKSKDAFDYSWSHIGKKMDDVLRAVLRNSQNHIE